MNRPEVFEPSDLEPSLDPDPDLSALPPPEAMGEGLLQTPLGDPQRACGGRREIALALPGEHVVDEELLGEVVSEINARYVRQGLKLAKSIGELLLDRFFGGDLGAFRNRGKRHLSLRALARRNDLQISYVQLWNCLSVLAQLRELPPQIGQSLSMHHHKALLPLRDASTKRALAERAVHDKLSYRQLQEEVRLARANNRVRRPGRPRLPRWVKGLRRIVETLGEVNGVRVDKHDFDYFDTHQARDLVEDLEAQIASLQRLKNDILANAADLERPLD